MSSSGRKGAEKEKEKDKVKISRTPVAADKERSKEKEKTATHESSKEKRAKPSTPSSKAKDEEKGVSVRGEKTPVKGTAEADALVSNAPVLGRLSSGKTGSSSVNTPALLNSLDSVGRPAGAASGNNPPLSTGARPRTMATAAAGSHATGDAAGAQSTSHRAAAPPLHRHRDAAKMDEPPVASSFLDNPSRDLGKRNDERDEDLDDDGIVASSRLALARMSFETCVVAAAHLQDLMMAHAAAVTSAQHPQEGVSPGLPPMAPRTRVNQVMLSTRPLDEIADDLARQLWQLCEAYQSSSRAERQLMGVATSSGVPMVVVGPRLSPAQMRAISAGNETAAVSGTADLSTPPDPQSNHTVREMGIAPGDTFGPMTSTQLIATADDFDDRAVGNGDDGDGSREAHRWLIDVGQANPGPRLAAQEGTQFVYPDGTRVSFPISTFGELVSTERMDAAAVDDWARSVETPTMASQPAKHVDSGDPLFDDKGGGGTAVPAVAADSKRIAATPPNTGKKEAADGQANNNGMDTELLHGYLRALEAKLTDKQRLDALREARAGPKPKEGRASISSLSHVAQSKSLADSKSLLVQK